MYIILMLDVCRPMTMTCIESSWRSMIGQSVQMLCRHHLLVPEACLLLLPRGQIALSENTVLLLHPRVDVPYSLVVT